MECHVHPGREAYGLCVSCGLPACQECLVTLHGQEYCRTCLEKMVAGAPAAPAEPATPMATAPVEPSAPEEPPAPMAPAAAEEPPPPGDVPTAPPTDAPPEPEPDMGTKTTAESATGPRVLGPQGSGPQSAAGTAAGTGPRSQGTHSGPGTSGDSFPPPRSGATPGAAVPPPPTDGPTLSGKNDGLATLLALFPGLGHLYLGFKVRGLQLLVGFIAAQILVDILYLNHYLEPWLTLGAVFFSVFDVRESIGRLRRGAAVPDAPLVEWDGLSRPEERQRLLAYGLIGLGGLALLRALLDQGRWLSALGWNASYVERTFLALVLIGAGLWALTSGRRQPKS